jgi:hypothetical protein
LGREQEIVDELRNKIESVVHAAKQLFTLVEEQKYEQREQSFPYFLTAHNFPAIIKASEFALPGFATLETGIANDIGSTLRDFQEYLDDPTRRRPHNLLMFAQPGSGKSHLVSCISKSLCIPQVTGNLSSPDPLSVLKYVINEARNFKAQDIVPLLFFDEVEAQCADLLQVLWDGELFISGQVMKLGRCIIVCAASNIKLEASLEMKKETEIANQILIPAKWDDFLSRFDAGILKIGSINDANRDLDRLCIVAKLFQRRFPRLGYVSLGLLQFLSQIKVKYEVRSLEFLVNFIPANSVFNLPSEYRSASNLNYGFLSLSRKYNGSLRNTFEKLFDNSSASFNPLALHIEIADLANARELWSACSSNIGLLEL